MLLQSLNFYSLLVPIILLSLSLITLWLTLHKKIADYLVKYAWSLALMGITILLNTALPAPQLSNFASVLAFMYFLSCSFHSQVLYQRLNVPFSWPICMSLIALGTCSVLIFSQFYENQMLRISSIALLTCAIHLHRPIQFYRTQTHTKLDAYLKVISYVFIVVVLSRGIFLSFIHDGQGFIAHYAWIWALTQFIIIVFYLLFFVLLIASACYDIMFKLNKERHLDALTGLYNRRGFYAYVERMRQAQHHQHVLLMTDLDHFKKINDCYGHAVGDQVLQHISRLLRQNVREFDHVARIGGEEFVIVLQDIKPDSAYKMAEQIRHRIEQTPFEHIQHPSIALTISMGVSLMQFPEQIDSALLAADELLYKAKSKGRNQIQYPSKQVFDTAMA